MNFNGRGRGQRLGTRLFRDSFIMVHVRTIVRRQYPTFLCRIQFFLFGAGKLQLRHTAHGRHPPQRRSDLRTVVVATAAHFRECQIDQRESLDLVGPGQGTCQPQQRHDGRPTSRARVRDHEHGGPVFLHVRSGRFRPSRIGGGVGLRQLRGSTKLAPGLGPGLGHVDEVVQRLAQFLFIFGRDAVFGNQRFHSQKTERGQFVPSVGRGGAPILSTQACLFLDVDGRLEDALGFFENVAELEGEDVLVAHLVIGSFAAAAESPQKDFGLSAMGTLGLGNDLTQKAEPPSAPTGPRTFSQRVGSQIRK
mmetsp:Transcript_17594/g.39823  ORF Transcript_17594/g.39823 Transcript_17594/m.39823 type:complete len:307 (+) Transcript_17594:2601-3521(+)